MHRTPQDIWTEIPFKGFTKHKKQMSEHNAFPVVELDKAILSLQLFHTMWRKDAVFEYCKKNADKFRVYMIQKPVLNETIQQPE